MPAPNEDNFNEPVLPDDDKPMRDKPKRAADMTAAERLAFLRQAPPAAVNPVPGKHVNDMDAAELAKFEAFLGVRPSHAQLALRRRNMRSAHFNR